MTYQVNYTDINNKSPITVFDNTSSTDTSLTFPGRNVTGYGQIIAENFLHLLENFASATEPVNPVEGQLWYDNANNLLMIWDNTNWKAASGIQKGPTEPGTPNSNVGELWIDTTNQQLRIYSGTRWILVGPSESSIEGLRYGPSIETIVDSDNITRRVLTVYLKDVPIIIISKDSFTPKITIAGYPTIKAGININIPANASEQEVFEGGLIPKLYGTAQSADALTIQGVEVPAGRFLRSDTVNTIENAFNIKNNAGLTLGVDGTFNLSASSTAARIYNSAAGSSLDLQTNRNGVPTTVLRIVDNRVAINKVSPDYELDVVGSANISGSLIVNDTTASTNLSNGSIRTAGGMAITKNLIVGNGLDVAGTTQTHTIQPEITNTYDLGSSLQRWKTVRAKTIIADEIQGVLNGNISGNANTATNLKNVTTFQLAGDVASPAIQFDGQLGSYTKVFNTTLTSNIIASKDTLSLSDASDFVLVYRPSQVGTTAVGLYKQTRDTFVGDLGVPIGAIFPYAKVVTNKNALPEGYLLCDGSEVERVKYPRLFDVIGTTYNGTAPLNGIGTFRLPDLRGRFPLGRDNMDNAETVPTTGGTYVDAGGGLANRVSGTSATTVGGSSGQSSTTLIKANLPDHEHTLVQNGKNYSAVLVDPTISPPATPGLGPTATGQAQYIRKTGPVENQTNPVTLGTPVGIMNPYLTINYIIRSGKATF